MIRINLLPPAKRKPKYASMRILTVVCILLMLFMGGMYGNNMYKMWCLECQINENRAKYELLRPTQEKMQSTNDKQQMINSKNALLVNLTNNRKSWYAIVAHFGAITPPQVWLNEFGAIEKDSVKLKGSAVTYSELAGFLQKIKQDDYFFEPVLDKAETDAKLLTSFEITVRIKGM